MKELKNIEKKEIFENIWNQYEKKSFFEKFKLPILVFTFLILGSIAFLFKDYFTSKKNNFVVKNDLIKKENKDFEKLAQNINKNSEQLIENINIDSERLVEINLDKNNENSVLNNETEDSESFIEDEEDIYVELDELELDELNELLATL